MLADLTTHLLRHGRTLLDIALPSMCPACGLSGVDLGKRCPACLKDEIFYSRARQAAPWSEPLITLVERLKYGHIAELAEPMARILLRPLQRDHGRERWDLIAPVPLHRVRERERGYNQSALIARRLGRILGWPVDERAVVRHRRTLSQTRLGRADRMRNVVGAFSCPEPEALRGRRVLLIDDVYTTGSTMNETAKALIEAGAESVFALAVARAQG